MSQSANGQLGMMRFLDIKQVLENWLKTLPLNSLVVLFILTMWYLGHGKVNGGLLHASQPLQAIWAA